MDLSKKYEVIDLFRYDKTDKQTIGKLVYNEYVCNTLELPWLDNRFQVSCVPLGMYLVEQRYSTKYGTHFHVNNVPKRNLILIHSGNYHTHTKGCILVGSGLVDINNDGYTDVTNSRNTLKHLLDILPASFMLRISEAQE
jgi:hypothetical protein